MKRTPPFQTTKVFEEGVEASLTSSLIKLQRRMISDVMSPQNILGYAHGSKWGYPGNVEEEDGDMETHKAEFEIPYRRVIDGDIRLVEEPLSSLSKSFHQQLMQSMYALMSRTCDRTPWTLFQ